MRALPPLTAQPREGSHPLSLQQRGLLAAMRAVGDDHSYDFVALAILDQGLDRGRLLYCLERLAYEHTALRTSIQSAPHGVEQYVSRENRVSIELDTTKISSGPAYLDALEQELINNPSSAFAVPLTTLVLVSGPAWSALAIRTHHLVFDLWSWGIYLQDLAALYYAHREEPTIHLTYSDYARWQRANVHADRYAHHRRHWEHLLAKPPDTASLLPGSRRASAGATAYRFRLDKELWSQCTRAATAAMVRPFRVLLATFHGAVARLTDSADIFVGSATANRNQPDTRGIVGFLANGRVSRTKPSASTSVAELISAVDTQWQAGDRHAEIHLEQMVHELGLDRLVNIKLSLQDVAHRSDRPGSPVVAKLARLARRTTSSRRDLSVELTPTAGALEGLAVHRLLDDTPVRQLVADWIFLIEVAAVAPQMSMWVGRP